VEGQEGSVVIWGCGHVTDEQGNVLNIKCVECYIDWYCTETCDHAAGVYHCEQAPT
jgi:hypothetical protein